MPTVRIGMGLFSWGNSNFQKLLTCLGLTIRRFFDSKERTTFQKLSKKYLIQDKKAILDAAQPDLTETVCRQGMNHVASSNKK